MNRTTSLQEQKTCPMLLVEEQDSWRATIKPVILPFAGRTKTADAFVSLRTVNESSLLRKNEKAKQITHA